MTYRQLARQFHKQSCVYCNSNANLEVHHINENHRDCRVLNLVFMCHEHHMILHRKKKNERALRDNIINSINEYQEQFKKKFEVGVTMASYQKTAKMFHERCCVYCKKTESMLDRPLEVHHINKNHKDNSIMNLVYICKQHHIVIHRKFGGSERRLRRKINIAINEYVKSFYAYKCMFDAVALFNVFMYLLEYKIALIKSNKIPHH